jgi:hypothetical protein
MAISWLKSWLKRSATPGEVKSMNFTPRLEPLEIRTTPANIVVTVSGYDFGKICGKQPDPPVGLTFNDAIDLANSNADPINTITFSLAAIHDWSSSDCTDNGAVESRRVAFVTRPVIITKPVIIDGVPLDNVGTEGPKNHAIVFDPTAGIADGVPLITVNVGVQNNNVVSIQNLRIGSFSQIVDSIDGTRFTKGFPGANGPGVFILDGAQANIQNCTISGNGLSPSADPYGPLANISSDADASGVYIRQAVNNNVGTLNAGFGNTISGNGTYGVHIKGDQSVKNQVLRNVITGNGLDGVFVEGATGNFIGNGTVDAAGNTIFANTRNAVYILNAPQIANTPGNQVTNNILGGDGSTPTNNNGADGVRIENSPDVLVGGTTTFAKNTIGANNGNGIQVIGATSTNVRIQQNVIGGTGRANSLDGIFINDAPGVAIGGANPAGNTITRNTKNGIRIVGTNSVGTTILNNDINNNVDNGIADDSGSGTIIGGANKGTGNKIDSNGLNGILLQNGSDNSTVQGNTISNHTQDGVKVDGSNNILIGGLAPNAGNIIDTNRNGVYLLNGTTMVTLQNNTIRNNVADGVSIETSNTINVGTGDQFGDNKINNNRNGVKVTPGSAMISIKNNSIDASVQDGIFIDGVPNVVIGGIDIRERNVIGGSGQTGIHLENGSSNTSIFNNWVGTKADGVTKNGNGQYGLLINTGSNNNTVGGSIIEKANIFSGSGINGIRIAGASTGNVVQGNFIGTGIDGTTAIGNGDTGIIIDASNNNLIGGTVHDTANLLEEGNVIGNNGVNGVAVVSGTGNRILGNSIFGNSRLGIELGNTNTGTVTPNDKLDPDGGANRLQNYPVITFAETNIAYTRINGTLNSTANRTFRIELYNDTKANPGGTPAGFGQGKTFLLAFDVTTNASGDASFSVKAPVSVVSGTIVSGTATDTTTDDTSEFSKAFVVSDAIGTVSGMKFDDTNGNGIKDPGEPGLQGWEISLDVDNDSVIDAKTLTDVNGNYSFARLPDGNHFLTETLQKNWVQTATPFPNPFGITGGLPVTDADFGNFRVFSISGRKFNDLNGNAIRDNGEPPIEGVTIRLLNANNNVEITRTTTDKSGNYIFQNLGPGTYRIREVVPPRFAQTTPNPADIPGVSGVNVVNIDFGNKQSGGGGGGGGGGTGDIDYLVVGADAGGGPQVRVYTPDGKTNVFTFFAYDSRFLGGVRVAVGDVDADGIRDIVTVPGPGGGPHVKVFSGADGSLIRNFMAYDPAFRGGLFVASVDANGDGFDDIITGADAGGGPHVRIFDGLTQVELRGFFAYATGFRGGVRVGAGLDASKAPFVVTGPGQTGGPHVRVFDAATGGDLYSFFAYNEGFRGGIYVAAGNVNGQGSDDIITGPGIGGGPHVRVFDGDGAHQEIMGFIAYAEDTGTGGGIVNTGGIWNGVRVASHDADGDGFSDVVVGPGPGKISRVKAYSANPFKPVADVTAFSTAFLGGVFVG